MVLYLPWKTFSEFEQNLRALIRTEASHASTPIPFLHCQHPMTRALLNQRHWQPFLSHLELLLIHDPEDLLYLLKSLGFRKKLGGKNIIILSPYAHLLEGLSLRSEKEWVENLQREIAKLEEKYTIHVVVAEN
ncbi:MAG: hypothetical protein Q8P05_03335 [Candidatus Diapherotrites archaeon]|nr:hypothetical protein [Candidatus Diapherotrites archaeon]